MVKAKKKKQKPKKKHKKLGETAKTTKPPRNSKGQLISGWGKGSKQVKKKEAKKKVKKKVKKKLPARRVNGTLLPGNTANAEGKNRGSSRLDELNSAIRRVEEKKNRTFLDMCVEKAWKDTAMAIAILRKLHPDLKAIQTQEVPGDGMSEEEKEEIRKEHKKRFEGLYDNSNAHE